MRIEPPYRNHGRCRKYYTTFWVMIFLKAWLALCIGFNGVSENETLKKSRTGSPCNQSDSDDIDLNEKSRTSPRTVSVASSRTESKSITKSAKKEISAILDTTSSADEKESLKSDVDDASVDKDGEFCI